VTIKMLYPSLIQLCKTKLCVIKCQTAESRLMQTEMSIPYIDFIIIIVIITIIFKVSNVK